MSNPDWGDDLPEGQFACPHCDILSDADEVDALGGRCPFCGKYDVEGDPGRHYGATDDPYSLPAVWKGYQDWWGENPDHPARDSIQLWGNVEDYLLDRHGVSPYDEQIHPACLAAAKLHSLAQGRPQVDGYEGTDDYLLTDDDKVQGAALGLLKIRRNHHTASTDGIRYAHIVEADVAEDLWRMRLAAVTQDLVDRLHDEFDDWMEAQPAVNFPQWGIGHWPNIEKFLKDKYPAAHRGLGMGMEEAQPLIDQKPRGLYGDPMPEGRDPYPTGPEAESQHGYDPKEIAAGMLLLHNKANPFRGEMVQEDQDRLNDIFTKRQQMQRSFEERTASGDDYRMRHRPPEPEDGSSMHDPSNVFPDIHEHPEWYNTAPAGRPNPRWGKGELDYWRQQQQSDRESYAAIMKARGNPDAPITIYRALPTSAANPDGSFPMNTGDWVTPSPTYAKMHGDSNIVYEPYSVIKHVVPARLLNSGGESMHEWGYNGDSVQARTAARLAMPTVYHGTDEDKAQAILDSQSWLPGNGGWFSTDLERAKAYGPAVVSLDVPDHLVPKKQPEFYIPQNKRILRKGPFNRIV